MFPEISDSLQQTGSQTPPTRSQTLSSQEFGLATRDHQEPGYAREVYRLAVRRVCSGTLRLGFLIVINCLSHSVFMFLTT